MIERYDAAPPLQVALTDVVNIVDATSCVFLGFLVDGVHVISYREVVTYESTSSVQFYVQLWQFSGFSRMKKLCDLPLFGESSDGTAAMLPLSSAGTSIEIIECAGSPFVIILGCPIGECLGYASTLSCSAVRMMEHKMFSFELGYNVREFAFMQANSIVAIPLGDAILVGLPPGIWSASAVVPLWHTGTQDSQDPWTFILDELSGNQPPQRDEHEHEDHTRLKKLDGAQRFQWINVPMFGNILVSGMEVTHHAWSEAVGRAVELERLDYIFIPVDVSLQPSVTLTALLMLLVRDKRENLFRAYSYIVRIPLDRPAPLCTLSFLSYCESSEVRWVSVELEAMPETVESRSFVQWFRTKWMWLCFSESAPLSNATVLKNVRMPYLQPRGNLHSKLNPYRMTPGSPPPAYT